MVKMSAKQEDWSLDPQVLYNKRYAAVLSHLQFQPQRWGLAPWSKMARETNSIPSSGFD